MKKHWIFCGVTLLCAASILCSAEGVEGVITASWLNARIFPALKSSRVTKLPRGQKVSIFQRHGGWLEIAAPDTTPVFASAAYISGNKVLRDLNLRTSPDNKGPVIARVKKGTLLKAVSEPNRYGWVQVAPSADMRLYVVENYVSYDKNKVPVARNGFMPQVTAEKKAEAAPVTGKVPVAAEKKAEVEKKAAPAPEKKAEAAKKAAPAAEKKVAPAAEKAPVAEKKAEVAKKAAPAVEKKAEAKFELTVERKQELLNIGADITNPAPYAQSGILVAGPNPGGDCTKYALAGSADGSNKGFLFAAASVKLDTMLEKEVTVKGFAYRVPKWKNPVVAVTQITSAGAGK